MGRTQLRIITSVFNTCTACIKLYPHQQIGRCRSSRCKKKWVPSRRVSVTSLASRYEAASVHPHDDKHMARGGRKFYGVARGRVPGVYATWDEAKRQVDAFKGAVHKSFSTYAEAREWVASQNSGADDVFAPPPPRPAAAEYVVEDDAATMATRVGSIFLRDSTMSGVRADAGARASTTQQRERPPPAPAPARLLSVQYTGRPFLSPPLSDGTYTLHFDGACRGGRPGRRGAIIRREGDDAIVFESPALDTTRPTTRRRQGLIGGPAKARARHRKPKSHGHSLLVNRVNGDWKVKNAPRGAVASRENLKGDG